MQSKINILTGTTASGKTKYAVELAKNLNAEIINADSMQVYNGLPILTAQPTNEEMQNIPHHLYGIISCNEKFNVAQWIRLAKDKIKEVESHGKTPLLVGGTVMYIKSLVFGLSPIPVIPAEIKQDIAQLTTQHSQLELYHMLMEQDPETARQIQVNDRQRTLRALEVILATKIPLSQWQKQSALPPFPQERYHMMLLERPRHIVYENINRRFLEMIDIGALAEVRKTYNELGSRSLPKAHGLFELINYINGCITLDEAIRFSQRNTRHYVKRQTTWFKHQFNFDAIISLP